MNRIQRQHNLIASYRAAVRRLLRELQATCLAERLVLLLLLVTLVFVYSKPLGFYLVSEDLYASGYFDQSSKSVSWGTVKHAFWNELPVAKGTRQYRPLFGLFFGTAYSLFGSNTVGWHALLLLLHGVVVALVAFFSRQLLRLYGMRQYKAAMLATLAFLLFPQNAITFSWCAAMSDVCHAIGAVAALLLVGRAVVGLARRQWLTVSMSFGLALCAFCFAFLSKESALALGPVLLVHLNMVWFSNRAIRKRTSWLAANMMLIPFAIVELGYVMFRKALFGEAFAMYWKPVALDVAGVPLRLGRFLGKWMLPYNPFFFADHARLMEIVTWGIGLLVLFVALASMASCARRWPRIKLLLHCAFLFIVLAGPVAVSRLDAPAFGATIDSYAMNIPLLIALSAIFWNAGCRLQRISITLLYAVLGLWSAMLYLNLEAIERSMDLNRALWKVSNRRANAGVPGSNIRMLNRPFLHYGITCAWCCDVPDYLKFPFRENPMEGTWEWQISDRAPVFVSPEPQRAKLVPRSEFFPACRTILDTQSGSLEIVTSQPQNVVFHVKQLFKRSRNQFLYLEFETATEDEFNVSVVAAEWESPKFPHHPLLRSDTQDIRVAKYARDKCDVLFNLGSHPLYAREAEPVSKIRVFWNPYAYPEKTPMDLSVRRARLLEYVSIP